MLAAAPAAQGILPSPFTWSGHHYPRNWSEGANWEGGTAPATADGTVDLDFPLSACEPWPTECPTPTDDISGLTLGTLTLQGFVIRWSGLAPFELPPPGLHPESWSVDGTEALKLAGGIVADIEQEGTGEGVVGNGGISVSPPLVLTADNSWSVGPSPGSLNILSEVTGSHALHVTLGADNGLELEHGAEVGPLTISGGRNSYLGVGGFESDEDLNGESGSPVTVEGASLFGGGATGPLTLAGGAYLSVGSRVGGGELHVHGDFTADPGTLAAFEIPEPAWGPPSELVADGRAEIQGARLNVAASCPATGTYTLVQAAGGITGVGDDQAGVPIPDGTVLPGAPDGCGTGRPGPALRIEYHPDTITATVVAGAASVPPAGSAPVGSGGAAAPGASGALAYLASARAALRGDLAAGRFEHSIRRLLRAGGETVAVTAPAPGRLTVRLLFRHGHRSVTIASGTLAFAGHGHLHLRLSAAGRALLRRSHHLSVEAVASFLGAGGPAVAAQTVLKLHG